MQRYIYLDMALPVLIGPNRCELIYNHDKQPLLELSLRVSLPVIELLNMLSQLAPPAKGQAVKPQRPPTKGPTSGAVQGRCASDWQPSYSQWEQDFRQTWEPCPVAPRDGQGEWTTSDSQLEEQAQLLWALSDQAVPRYRKVPPKSAQGKCSCQEATG